MGDEAKTAPDAETKASDDAVLAVYGQLWDSWRHNDTIGWGAGSFLVTATLAGLIASFSVDPCFAAAAVALGSFLPMVWWFAMQHRLASVTYALASEIIEIEKGLGLKVSAAIEAQVRGKGVRFKTQWMIVGLLTAVACGGSAYYGGCVRERSSECAQCCGCAVREPAAAVIPSADGGT